jgi:2-keto-4-pentenoate hydratase
MRPVPSEPAGPQAVAQALLRARRGQAPVDAAPLERELVDPADAYAVQEIVARELALQRDPVARHWKSGGPTRPGTLTHAPLPDAGVWASPAKAGSWHFNLRLIEAEVALRLARDVTPQQAAELTHEAAPALVDAMAVSIEVVDSRWTQGPKAAALLKLADLQSHGALVLGAWTPFAARDWSQQVCRVAIGDAAAREFRGSHSLEDPAWLLPVWLRHVTRDGRTVPRGTVVTTGTWCGMLPAEAGDLVRVAFDAIGEASVQF